jgi:hypothetical protein
MPTVTSIDRQIERRGQTLILRRQGVTDLPVKGIVRGYQAIELIGDVQQGDREVRISNMKIAANWPSYPIRTDKIVIDGRQTTVQSVETRFVNGDPAMHIIQVRG